MRRTGYVRPIRGLPVERQRARLRHEDIEVIYSDPDPLDAIDAMWAGDELWIYPSLTTLADTFDGIRAAVDQARLVGGLIVVVGEIGEPIRRADPDGVSLMAEAVQEIRARSRRGKHLPDQSRDAIRERWKHTEDKRTGGNRAVWLDQSIPTNAEAAERIGVSVSSCIRWWGKSGRKAGRPWPEPKDE